MMISKTVRPSFQLFSRCYTASSKVNPEIVAAGTTSVPSGTATTPTTLPVTGHKLSYSEFGDPSTVIRKERFQIDAVPENHVSLIGILGGRKGVSQFLKF